MNLQEKKQGSTEKILTANLKHLELLLSGTLRRYIIKKIKTAKVNHRKHPD